MKFILTEDVSKSGIAVRRRGSLGRLMFILSSS